jgi:hypothetical protein
MTNHRFRWIALNDTGPIYRCEICSGTLTASHKKWTSEEFQRGDYRTPPAFLNELPSLLTCEEIIVRKIQAA